MFAKRLRRGWCLGVLVSVSVSLWCWSAVALAAVPKTYTYQTTTPPHVGDTMQDTCENYRATVSAAHWAQYNQNVAYNISIGSDYRPAEPGPFISTLEEYDNGNGLCHVGNGTNLNEWGIKPIIRVMACPAGSTEIDGACGCDPGYVERQGQCIRIVDRDYTGEPQSCPRGNPIYPLSGTKREEVDLGIHAGAVRLRLAYDSTPMAPVAAGGARPVAAKTMAVGPLWSSSGHRNLALRGSGAMAAAARGDGRTVNFNRNAGGAYIANTPTLDRLAPTAQGFRYTDAAAQSLESYDSAGKLLAIHWASGQALSLAYSTTATAASVAPAPGYLIEAQDRYGRLTKFEYQLPSGADPATGGLLAKILDAQGQATQLAYTTAAATAPYNLASITWPDGAARQYHYDLPAWPQALAGISDELGVRYANFGYDAQGRAISTGYLEGAGLFSVTYTNPPEVLVTETYDSAAKILYRDHTWKAPQGTLVRTPGGAFQGMGATSIQGRTYLTSQSQPAGSGCAASTSQTQYDARGNATQMDDFNGTRACLAWDAARNLKTASIEGLASTGSETANCSAVTPTGAALPAGSRKTSTEWHPDWSLAIRVAEPGRRLTSVYNGQPDPFNGNAIAACAPASALLPDGKPIVVLCKQLEQASLDADGSQGFAAALQAGAPARTRQWTYNAAGQVLSETDPLNRTTLYTYYADTSANHRPGDLQSLTNPAGQTSQYTRYNARGQLLEMQDANGVATVHAYDARGRLLSATVGGEATSFSHDASGQPRRTTFADGSWIELEYDHSRRMNAVKDNLGNRIDYVLDAQGQVTGQNAKDPAGAIRRALARSLDALGRVQQAIGR